MENIGELIILGVIFVVCAGYFVFKLIPKKKKGCGCGCDCNTSKQKR